MTQEKHKPLDFDIITSDTFTSNFSDKAVRQNFIKKVTAIEWGP